MRFDLPVDSIKEFFRLVLAGAALMIGWTFGGKVLIPFATAVWGALTRII